MTDLQKRREELNEMMEQTRQLQIRLLEQEYLTL